jgi:hypothetical protein
MNKRVTIGSVRLNPDHTLSLCEHVSIGGKLSQTSATMAIHQLITCNKCHKVFHIRIMVGYGTNVT